MIHYFDLIISFIVLQSKSQLWILLLQPMLVRSSKHADCRDISKIQGNQYREEELIKGSYQSAPFSPNPIWQRSLIWKPAGKCQNNKCICLVIKTKGMEDWRLYNFWFPHGQKSHEFGGSANWAWIEETCKQYTHTEITEWWIFYNSNPEISYLALLLQFDERFGEADGGGGGESSHWPKFLDWKSGILGGGTKKQWTLRFLQLKKTSGRFKSRSH